jgi:hypothetical protein
MAEMHATADWVGGFGTRLGDGRGHEVAVDLSTDEEGLDAGTSALELNLLSLAGCITTIFALVARRRRVTYSGLDAELEAERPQAAPAIPRVRGGLSDLHAVPEGRGGHDTAAHATDLSRGGALREGGHPAPDRAGEVNGPFAAEAGRPRPTR